MHDKLMKIIGFLPGLVLAGLYLHFPSAQAASLLPGPGAHGEMSCPLTINPGYSYGPNYAIDWGHGGDNYNAQPGGPPLFDASTSSQVYTSVGIERAVNNTEAFFRAGDIPSTLDLSVYNQYTFTTSDALSSTAELYGFGYFFRNSIGSFRFALQIDDDPAFNSPVVVSDEVAVDRDNPTGQVAITKWGDEGFAQYESDNIVRLAPNTTYYMRLYPYDIQAVSSSSAAPAGLGWDFIQIEDITLFATTCIDFSDVPANGVAAPVGDGSTTSYGVASHDYDNALRLGPTVTVEDRAIEGADDSSDNGIVLPALTAGNTEDVTIAAADITGIGTATLHGWIDFDGNGSFDADEYASVGFNNGATGDLTFSGYGETMASGTTYARFRLTTDTLINTDAATVTTDGEVEDYLIIVKNKTTPTYNCTPDEMRASQRYWYIGAAGLDFGVSGTDLPTPVIDSAMNALEGSAAAADASGELQFYTDGNKIWNRDNDVMISTLGGSATMAQTVIYAAFSGDSDKYLVIANTGRALNYQYIDMSLNNGLGGAIGSTMMVPNSLGNRSEALNAIADASGEGIWVVSSDQSAGSHPGAISAFRFDENGPTGEYVSSPMSQKPGIYYPVIDFSPDGSQLATYGGRSILVFDFDASTGIATERVSWPSGSTRSSSYGITFSPEGKYIYIANWVDQYVYRYKIDSYDSATIKASEENLGIGNDKFGAGISRGPDGRVWIANYTRTALRYIGNPDADSVSLQLFETGKRLGVNLPSSNAFSCPLGSAQPSPAYDYSDTPVNGDSAPDGNNVTAYDDASHEITTGLLLGSTITDEVSAIEGEDDADGSGSDDGVVLPVLAAGATADVVIPAGDISGSGTGTVHAWIDLDGNGSFDTDEYASVGFNDGAAGNLTFSGYGTTMGAGTTYARFRLTTDALGSADAATTASDGEVEDYAVTVNDLLPPFSCGPEFYESIHDTLFKLDPATGVYTQIGDPVGMKYNSAGYNINDNYIYAIGREGALASHLMRIGANGVYEDLGAISSTNSISGDMDANNNLYFATYGTNVKKVNVLTKAESSINFTGSAGSMASDVVYLNTNGNEVLVGARNGRLRIWNLTTLVASSVEVPGLELSDYGAAWTALNGHLYLSANDTGTIYEITDALGTPQIVARYRAAITNDHDGTSCPQASAALSPDRSDAPVTYAEATHGVLEGIHLGTANDRDITSILSADASGDGADDDGVTFPALTKGAGATIPVRVTGTGYLQAWIDWDGNGDFADIGDQIAANIQDGGAGDADGTANGTIEIAVTVPATAITSQTFARFRWSSEQNLGSTDAAFDGEVEDYAVTVNDLLPPFSCGPEFYESIHDTLFKLDPATGVYTQIGDPVGMKYNSAGYNINDNYIYAIGREGALASHLMRIGANGAYEDLGAISSTNSISGDMDANNNLYFATYGTNVKKVNVLTKAESTINFTGSAGSMASDVVYLNTNGNEVLVGARNGRLRIWNLTTLVASSVEVPGLELSDYGAAWTALNGHLYLSANDTGTIYEITDALGTPQIVARYRAAITNDHDGTSCPQASAALSPDRSDAPVTYAEATHGVLEGIHLGTANDRDITSILSADASGDGADDDGVTFPALTKGAGATIPVRVTGTGYLQAWIDWDGNGDFADIGDQIAANIQDGGAGDADGTANGTIEIAVTVPATAITSQTFARFRWSSEQNLGSTDAAFDGEVEDYVVTIQSETYKNNFCVTPVGATGFLNFDGIPATSVIGAGNYSYQNQVLPGYGTVDLDISMTGGLHKISTSAQAGSKHQSWTDAGLPNVVTGGGDAIYLEPDSNGTATLIYNFDQPTGNTDLLLLDVDQDDTITLTAKDENGVDITNFSGWRYRGGDMSTWGWGVAPVPAWDATTATLTSTDNNNNYRSFGLLTPDTLVSQIVVSFTASAATGQHIYSSLYTTDAGRDGEVSCPPVDGGICPAGEVLVPIADKTGWNILSVSSSSEGGGDQLIDDNVRTRWVSDLNGDLPQSTVLDLGQSRDIGGLWYYAKQWDSKGKITSYVVEVSNDNIDWREVAEGTLATEEVVPRLISFAEENVRYLRLKITGTIGGQYVGITELSPLNCAPAPEAQPVSVSSCGSFDVFHTGHDLSNGGILPLKQFDKKWLTATVPTGTTNTIAAINDVEAWAYSVMSGDATGYKPGSSIANWHNSFSGIADWLTNSEDGRHMAIGSVDVLYRKDFSLDVADQFLNYLFTQMSLNFYVDNAVWDIVVNGTSLRSMPEYSDALPSSGRANPYYYLGYVEENKVRFAFSPPLLVDGNNSIVVHVKSAPDLQGFFAETDFNVACEGIDLSDAPLSYGRASHGLTDSGLYLGAVAPDADTDFLESPEADGDDVSGSDDESLSLPGLLQGDSMTLSIPVSQMNAGDGYLQGWIDWDSNGSFDANEQIATDLQSAIAGTSTIDINVTVPVTAVIGKTFARFRWSTASGLDNTGVASDGEVEDYALTVSSAVCGPVMTSVMPAGALSSAANASHSSVIGFDYHTRGRVADTPEATQLASAQEVGTVWGKAYNQAAEELYVSAFLRRHAGLHSNGLGAIYAIDVSNLDSSNTAGTPTLWMNINTPAHLGQGAELFPYETDANRGLGDGFAPSHDVWAFNRVGKEGIGGMDLSDDFSLLYVMDMTNRQLLSIDTSNKQVVARHKVNDPGCTGGDGDVRPFAVDYLKGSVYIGVTCSGETRQLNSDVDAFVMRLEGSRFTTVVSGAVGSQDVSFWDTRPYGSASNSCGTINPGFNDWVPVITNLELDQNNNMLVGVAGINGYRFGSRNYPADESCTVVIGNQEAAGRVMRATPTGDNWLLASSELNNLLSYDHFYADGQYAHWGTGSSNTYTGGMAISQCTGKEVAIVNLFDPLDFESAGTRYMRTLDGQHETAANNGDIDLSTSIGSTLEHYQGLGSTWEKSAGMGDLEYLNDETLNLSTGSIYGSVYQDDNGNDFYDTDSEAGIDGIAVSLLNQATGVVIASTSTTQDGDYVFSAVDVGLSYRIEVDANDADLPTGYALGTANPITGVTVTAGDITGDQDFGFDANNNCSLIVTTTVDSNNADNNSGSLRDAIECANETSGPDIITFDMPTTEPGYDSVTGVWTITPDTALPKIADADTTIDASTQTGTECLPAARTIVVAIDGSNTVSEVPVSPGISVEAERTVIRGMAIHSFAGSGVLFGATGAQVSDGSSLSCSNIGVNAAGDTAMPNSSGVDVRSSADITIGGDNPGDRNIISGNTRSGIFMTDADRALITNNYIGLNAAGTAAIPNADSGIQIEQSSDLVIGGGDAGKGNVISSQSHGILAYGVDNGVIQGNIIGATADQTVVFDFGEAAVEISNGSDNWVIGGSNTGEGNLIVGGANSNIGGGLVLDAVQGAVVQGNRIGLLPDGSSGQNSNNIHVLNSAQGILIGGTGAGEGNVVAGATLHGLLINSSAAPWTTVSVLGNSIFDNADHGIDLGGDGVSGNDAGDSDDGANGMLNHPVIELIEQNGANVDVTYSLDVPAGNYRIEFFDNPSGMDLSGHGEGEVFVGHQSINHDGAGESTFNFTLTGVTLSDVLNLAMTTTEDLGTGNFGATSEFSGMADVEVSGLVFEDLQYGGGHGRPFGTPGTVGANGVRLEIYNVTGQLVTFTDSLNDGVQSGAYSLSVPSAGQYYVRAVSDSVSSSRSGSNGDELGVMTFRTDGVTDVADEVGGHNPAVADAGSNDGSSVLNTTTFTFSGGNLDGSQAQAVQPVTLGAGGLEGVSFGFNFNTVVNTNGSGQGSLAQFVENTNLLDSTGITQSLPAELAADYGSGDTVAVFMIPADSLVNNEAVINQINGLSINQGNIIIDGRSQQENTGAGDIIIRGDGTTPVAGVGFSEQADGSVLREVGIDDFGGSGVVIFGAGDSGTGVSINSVDITGNGQYGVLLLNDAANNRIMDSSIRDNHLAGISNEADSNNTYSRNSIVGNGELGIDLGSDGVTENSNTDAWLNYPEVGEGSTISSNGSLIVSYDFDLEVPANTYGYRVEFFSNAVVDPSGHGEGETYLGYVDTMHPGSGSTNFKGSLNANQAVSENANIAVTLTEITGDGTFGATSEFSGVSNGKLSVCRDMLSDPDAPLPTVTVNENISSVSYLEARDANGNPITYVISGGVDGKSFIFDPTPPDALFDCVTLRFIGNDDIIVAQKQVVPTASVYRMELNGLRQAPLPGDYEVPVDSDRDNTYEVEITAIDSQGNTVTKTIVVAVQDVNEQPVITSSAQFEFETGLDVDTTIVDLEAFDPDAGDAEGSGLTYSLGGGPDAGLFSIDWLTGEVRFKTTPDYNLPADSDRNNEYLLDVRVADDQGFASSKPLKVLVVDTDAGSGGVNLTVRALLQGAYQYDDGLMTDTLRESGVLPVNQPYTSEPFNYQGTEGINLDKINTTGETAVVDWVLVELRDSNDPAQIVATRAALVLRNGRVVGAELNGLSLNFPDIEAGQYYVSLRHRNHLGVMSAEPQALSEVTQLVDFTTPETAVYGDHARFSTDTVALLWSGDISQDQRLILSGQDNDMNIILTDVLTAPDNTNYNSSYQVQGYHAADLNMDGRIVFTGPSNDANILLSNILLYPANTNLVTNFIIQGGIYQK